MPEMIFILTEREYFALDTLLSLDVGETIEWPLELGRNIFPFTEQEADELQKKLDTAWRDAS